MDQTLEAIARHVQGRLIGDGATRIRGLNHSDAAQEGELTFAENARHLAEAMATQAAAILVSSEIRDLGGRAGISVAHPKLAFARLLERFYPEAAAEPGVHPSAVVGRDVRLGEGVTIRPHVVIGDRAVIGAGTVIESGVHVGPDVRIGEACFIAPNVVIYRGTQIGHRVRIHGGTVIGGDGFGYVLHEGGYVKVPQVGNVVIEDDVEIGCNACVDRATIGSTIIKRGTKIDNQVQIAHNNRIGEHVTISGQAGFAGSVTVGDYAIFGGKAGVVDHVTIGDKAQIGAASVVTKSVPSGQMVWGFPARPIRQAKEQMAALSRLPALIRRLTRLGKLEQPGDRLDRAPSDRIA